MGGWVGKEISECLGALLYLLVAIRQLIGEDQEVGECVEQAKEKGENLLHFLSFPFFPVLFHLFISFPFFPPQVL